MNTNSELERIVSGWLEARVADPPHHSLAKALARVDQTPQQRHRWLPWRFGRGRGATGSVVAPGRNTPQNDGRNRTMFSATAAATVAALALLAVLVAPPASEVAPRQALEPSSFRVAGDGSGDFITISEAVAAAQDGDTILVAPGKYSEGFIIDKDITLRGQVKGYRGAILTIPEDAPSPVYPLAPYDPRADRFALPEQLPVGIQLVDSDATVANLTVIGQGDDLDMLVHGGSPTLDGLTLWHDPVDMLAITLAGGLFIDGGSSANVTDTEVWYRTRIGGQAAPVISDAFFRFAQIAIQDGARPLIVDSNVMGDCGCVDTKVVGGSAPTFRGNKFVVSGLDIQGYQDDGTSAVLEGNSFSSSDTEALSVTNGATAVVDGNHFTSNYHGLRVSDASAEIRNNTFAINSHGIMLKDADATVVDNTIRGGLFGVAVTSSGSPVIRDNVIENTRTQGVYAAKGTSPVIEGNRICGSTANLKLDPEASPTLGDNDVCPDGTVAAAG